MESIKDGIKKYGYPVVLLLLMVIAGCLVRPVFYLNDDVTMRSILSGAYTGTPDGHAVYMQYPLTGMLAAFYRIIPVIPWLDLFFCGCIWLCMVLIAGSFEKKWLGSLLASVIALPFFLYMHYTLVAALVAATTVLLCSRKGLSVKVLLLWTISYMIRGQVGLLGLPFLVAAVVWQLCCSGTITGRKVKQAGIYCGALLSGILLITGINKLCYASEGWQNYQQYNDARTQLYDYTDFLSTNKYQLEALEYGMSDEEYQLLFSYNTMLASEPDGEKVQQIADKIFVSMKQDRTIVDSVKSGVREYYIQLRYHDFPYNYIWMGAFAFLGGCFLFQKKWKQVLFLGILFLGRSSIWIYLLIQGRFPERVSISLYLLELLLLLGIGLSGVSIRKTYLKKAGLPVLVVLSLGIGAFLIKDTCEKVEVQTETQQEWDALKKLGRINYDTTYLVDVFSAVRYGERLFAQENDNIMLLGGWLTDSPLANDRIEALSGTDATEVFGTNEDVRLVVSSERGCDWLEAYLAGRIPGSRLVLETELTFEGRSFLIYRLEKGAL